MAEQIDNERAADELAAAAKALWRANVLFRLIAVSIAAGEVEKIDALSLAEIGDELTATYGERAEGESKFFVEGA
jgi:hypothetical protein